MKSDNKLILVVDDESSIRRNLLDLLSPRGYNVLSAENGEQALEVFRESNPGLVILDINLPIKGGLEVLEEIKKMNKNVPVVMFTAFGNSERTINAMKLGAYDYIEKPFDLDEFLIIVERAFQYGNLLKEVEQLRTMVGNPGHHLPKNSIIANSLGMRELFKLIGRVASTDATVLIEGESGTGKELVADAICRHSMSHDAPYVKINCGAISESLLESEIFGHEKGAFTGAFAQRKGLFEIANGGTVYLDEINSMPKSLQVKLLRVIQKQPFFRVGGDKPIHVNVRIIASSNQDMKSEVDAGNFREDLYYRLKVVSLKVPPLRERLEDIAPLVEHFVNKFSPSQKIIVTKETIRKLKNYHWPGNVRELENMIQSAIITSSGEILEIGQLPVQSDESANETDYIKMIDNGLSFREVISEVEKKIILAALEKFNKNQSKTAEYLQMNRRLLYTRLKEWE